MWKIQTKLVLKNIQGKDQYKTVFRNEGRCKKIAGGMIPKEAEEKPMRKSKLVIFLSVFLLAHFVTLITHAATSGPLVFATGNKKGIYFSIGKTIAGTAGHMDIKIEILESEGSRENLLWVAEGKAQLCIAQGDTVYSAFNGLFPFQKKISNIQAIASLHTEAVHILVRRGLYLSQIDKFRGKRISIGPEGSGTEANARALIEAAGIATNEINLFHLNFDEAIEAIEQGRIDIVFFTSGYP
ncbi:MAG: TAXI family TRAP transporter solute-binding subunit, partial [Candidatus Aminicenantes bacterium]|nr:TAXI family TRAP transporter solute-binding subunit [Candidatus Aminicenantes bacterium]